MNVKAAIAKIKAIPGIKCEPKLHQQSEYVDTVKHKYTCTVQTYVYRQTYRVCIESYWRHKAYDTKRKRIRSSWVTLATGWHSTPEAAVKDWNDLVDAIKKG